MFKSPYNKGELVLTLPLRDEHVFQRHINRHFLIAFLASLLLHLVALWIFQPTLFSLGVPEKDAPPLEVTLGPPQKKEIAPSELVLPEPQKIPIEPIKSPAKKPKPLKKRKIIETPIKAVERSPIAISTTVKSKEELPKEMPKETSSDPLPGEDMRAYIKRQQEARLAKQGLSKRDAEEVIASSNPQSAGDKRDAKIKANLNIDGTNGIFEIRALSQNAAQFSFKGWKNNVNTARLEIFDVTVSASGNIKRAVIRRMIDIVRRDYDGDFNWDSRRLRQVLTLSARPEDNDELEAFMMLEIFGPGSPVR